MTDTSVGKLFLAGVLPGIMLMLMFSGYIAAWALLNPARTPPRESVTSFAQKLYAARHLIPAMALIATVIGSIYTGVATPTEAAAVGSFGSLVLAAAYRARDRKALRRRFYRALSIAEVGYVLGIAAEAARKRIDRALGDERKDECC